MSGLTDERLAELAAAAEAATPGEWRAAEGDLEGKPASEYVRTLLANREADGTSSGRLFLTLAPNDIDPELGAEVVPATTGDGPRAEANAAHIAAFDPPTALALVAEVQRLRAVVAEDAFYEAVLFGTCANVSAQPPMDPHPTCVFAAAAAVRSLRAALDGGR